MRGVCLAAWGFVVVGNDDPQAGNGLSSVAALKYALNNSELLKNKIDEENLGIVGYSQGGAGALRVLTMLPEGKKFKTIFTGSAAFPRLAKNMGWEYDYTKIDVPYFMTASTGTSDDRGYKMDSEDFAGVAPLESLEVIYDNMSDNVLKVRARATNAEHQDMLNRTDGYMTAWMLYQLKNDEAAGRALFGDNAEILTNSNWQDVKKNQ